MPTLGWASSGAPMGAQECYVLLKLGQGRAVSEGLVLDLARVLVLGSLSNAQTKTVQRRRIDRAKWPGYGPEVTLSGPYRHQKRGCARVAAPLRQPRPGLRLWRRGSASAPGRITAYTGGPVTVDDPGGAGPQVFNILRGQASQVRSTPFGEVGTVFSGKGHRNGLGEQAGRAHRRELVLLGRG